jgi:hypothetical protein
LTLVAAICPFGIVFGYLTTDPVFSYAVNLYLFDLPLALLAATTLPLLAVRIRARALSLGAALWTALALLVLLSFVVHPSIEGVQTVWRVAGALAIAVAFADLESRERSVVVGALVITALFQTAWAVAQIANGGPLGAWWLFESQKPLARVGDTFLPKGTLQTPYLLAALSLVSAFLLARRAVNATRLLPWVATIAAALVPVGLTYSRGALAGVVAAVAVLAPRARHDTARQLVIAAVLVGVGVPALLTSSAWLARGEQFSEDRPDSGRGIMLLQGITVLAMDPLAGVGPGRYMASVRTLTDDPAVRARLLPTHAVPLLVAAESGVLAGAVVVLLLVALALRAYRDRDDLALALYLVLLPFWLLDPLPYTLPQGIILSGFWLGGLDAAHGEHAA